MSVVIRQLAPYIAAALTLLALTFVVPGVNPYRPPLMDLTGSVAIAAYYLTLSGAGNVAPLTATVIILFLVARPGISWGRRLKEFVAVFVVVFGTMQGWMFAESLLKDLARQPRPVIVELATQPAVAPSLQMPIDAFYELRAYNPNDRRAHLEKVLGPEFNATAMDPRIRNHWQGMTDYGFPSGHSVGAMMNAMFALAMAFSYLSRKRWWFAYLVFAWGIAICYSRPILREHSPIQVLVGGTIGVCLALFAVMVSRLIIDKYLAPASGQQTAS